MLKPIDRALNDVMALAKAASDKEPVQTFEPKQRSPVGDRIIKCGEAAAQNYTKQASYVRARMMTIIEELECRALSARETALAQANEIDQYLLSLRMDVEFDIRNLDDDTRHDFSHNPPSGDSGDRIPGNGEASVQSEDRVQHDKQEPNISDG
jgi:hypothetical protein